MLRPESCMLWEEPTYLAKKTANTVSHALLDSHYEMMFVATSKNPRDRFAEVLCNGH